MQARALGANMIHSPVVDVNTNPKNPEIGTRAYSDNQDQVIKYALESLKGFKDTGLIATAKHFPGRGESETDAHWDLPSVNVDKETM
jgi:beta-N-acetylhexosaminidase